jgi:multidrug resistance efflux pump
MNRTLLLPMLAVVAFSFMSWHLAKSHQPTPDVEPPVAPSRNPFVNTIAGAGLVEPRSENIKVAAVVPGTVAVVCVRVGQQVEPGEVLFKLDDRQRQADLVVQRAAVAEAEANLRRARQAPRTEDLPPSAARLEKAQAELAAQKDLWDRAKELVSRKVLSQEEFFQRQQAYLAAKAHCSQVEAEDVRLRSGTWQEDLAVLEAQLARAQSLLRQAEMELDRLQIRAPIRGTVLKVDVRPGEYVGTPPGQTLLVLGEIEQLHVRVDIDEQDLPRFRPGLPGTGYVRGDANSPIELKFVRVEPYAEPKKSLTNAGNERVDTRVLQVVYALENPTSVVYVGQQLDVFLDAGAVLVNSPAAAVE